MGSCFSDLQVKQSSSDLQLLIANHFKASSAQCMRGSTIFFVSLFWCSFHFSQPCSLQFSLPIVYLFPALWQSLVDNVRGHLPRQSIGDCWTSGAKPGPSAAKIAPGHWFQTHTHSTLLPLLSSSYTWPSQNGDSLYIQERLIKNVKTCRSGSRTGERSGESTTTRRRVREDQRTTLILRLAVEILFLRRR